MKYANKGEYSTLSNQRCPAREEVSGTKKEKKKNGAEKEEQGEEEKGRRKGKRN